VWDLATERCAQRLMSGLDGPEHHLTALSEVHSQHSPAVVAAGATDGSIRLFDLRQGSLCAHAMHSHHTAAIVSLQSQAEDAQALPGLSNFSRATLVSGCSAGEICIWEPRTWTPRATSDAHRSALATLAVHPRAPVIAAGSRNNFIKVLGLDGEVTNLIRYHDGFLGSRIGPVSCVAFHPRRLLMAAGSTDSTVSIFTSATRPRRMA